MAKYLKPKVLEISPAINASAAFLHWNKTFDNFLVSAKIEDGEKLAVLINYVSSEVYESIIDCPTFKDAMGTLKSLYVKKKNEVFARHLLTTSRQEASESLSQYFQRLKLLARDCDFKAVSALEHSNQAVRGAFIGGILSSSIRQRLLESATLSMDQAFHNAETLEVAQQNSESFQQQSSFVASAEPKQRASESDSASESHYNVTAAVSKKTDKQCIYCGKANHARAKCPAKDISCFKCGKAGHFSSVCRGAKRQSSSYVAAMGLSKSHAVLQFSGSTVDALLDTGSTESFIKKSTARQLQLPFHSTNSYISMASTEYNVKISQFCLVSFSLNKHMYKNVKLLVMDNLCCSVILGHDFMGLHDNVTFNFGGKDDNLAICNVMAMSITPPRLFSHLTDDIRPIRTAFQQVGPRVYRA